MEDSIKKLQSLQSLDIQYLKSEKESLIKSNYAYSETISKMEVEISDLKAMLQAYQNENKFLTQKLQKLQETPAKPNTELIESLQKQIKQLTIEKASLEDQSKNNELDDLTEEVSELRDENLYLKGEYVPKLQKQLENARMLIMELESEVSILTKENEDLQKKTFERTEFEKHGSGTSQFHREFLVPTSPVDHSKDEKGGAAARNNKGRPQNYVPSIKRVEKNGKMPEFTIQISRNE